MRISDAFFCGIARIFDFSGKLKYHVDDADGRSKDWESLKGDWENVGKDIWKATASYKQGSTV